MEVKMKFCKDCKHLLGDLCKAPEVPRHMVTGELQSWRAIHSRNLPITGCGEVANWFEPIVEDADLDDLSTIPFGK